MTNPLIAGTQNEITASTIPVVEPTTTPAEPSVLSAESQLGAVIPTVQARRIAYAVYAGASLLVTNISVGFAATQTPIPNWLIVAIAIVGNLATPFAGIALANAKNPTK
jgi:hypothetical protein